MTGMENEGVVAFNGFISNTQDALILFEACKRGILPRTPARLSEPQRKAIKSGDIFVFNEEESKIKRWTDGRRWSPSRILNNFLIYRELEANESPPPTPVSPPQEPPNFLSSSVGSSKTQSARASPSSEQANESSVALAPAAQPSTAKISSRRGSLKDASLAEEKDRRKSVSIVSGPEEPKRALLGTLGGGGKLREGGFVKKTISVAGLHMISYYDTSDVLEGKLRLPTKVPELMDLEIGPQFLLAQYFRHPPQVKFDSEGVPHFAGLTDEEPMVRRPTQNPQQKKARTDSDQSSSTTSSMANMSITSRQEPFPQYNTVSTDTGAILHPTGAQLVHAHQEQYPHHHFGHPVHDPTGQYHVPMPDDTQRHSATGQHQSQASPFGTGHWSFAEPVAHARPPPVPLPTASGLTRSSTSLSSASDNSDPNAAAAVAAATSASSSNRPRAQSSSHRHEPYRLPSHKTGGSSGNTSATHSPPAAAHTAAYSYTGYNPDAPAAQYFPAPSQSMPKIDTVLANTAQKQQSRHRRSSSWQMTGSPSNQPASSTSFEPPEAAEDSLEITPTLATAPTRPAPGATNPQQEGFTASYPQQHSYINPSSAVAMQNMRGRPWSSPTDHTQQYPELRSFSVPSSNAQYFAYDQPFHYHAPGSYPANPGSLHLDTSMQHTSSPLSAQTPLSSNPVSPAMTHPAVAGFAQGSSSGPLHQSSMESMSVYGAGPAQVHPSHGHYQTEQMYSAVSPHAGYASAGYSMHNIGSSHNKLTMATVHEVSSSAGGTPDYLPEAQAMQYQQYLHQQSGFQPMNVSQQHSTYFDPHQHHHYAPVYSYHPPPSQQHQQSHVDQSSIPSLHTQHHPQQQMPPEAVQQYHHSFDSSSHQPPA